MIKGYNATHLNLLLVCNMGISTGLIVQKMEDIRDQSKTLSDMEVKIEAHPSGEIQEFINDFDIVLVGPQIKYQLSELKKVAAEFEKPIAVIDAKDYGTGNAASILKDAMLVAIKNQ